MATPHGQLSALATLIADAVKVVQTEFEKTSKPFVPSLDDITPHPLDDAVASMALRTAIQTIEGACAQLCATVARPKHTMLNRLMSFFDPACLQVVLVSKIPDILQESASGMHTSELSRRTGVEEGKLSRVLRLLATRHCFREVDKNVFANNRLSLQLLSTTPISDIGLYLTDEAVKSSTMLAETLTDPQFGPSYAPEHTPFNKWSKYPGTIYDWFDRAPDGVWRGVRFGIGMAGWSSVIDSKAIIQAFPWGDLDRGTSVCDVGGGVGDITIQLAKAYPHLQLKLQDSPERIQQAQDEVWPRRCPEAIRENRIEFKGMDFFVESPISRCDIYYLKNIIHNWPDDVAIKILTGVRKAMAQSSRVLIQEHVIEQVYDTGDTSIARRSPVPLLPNYGLGRIRQYNIDLVTMTLFNSKQRTLEEFSRLADASGLRFVKVWDLGETYALEYGLGSGVVA